MYKWLLILSMLSVQTLASGQKPAFHANMRIVFESLEEAAGDLTNVYHLKLEGKNLSEVPEEISLMPNLVSLYLSDNELTDLGDRFDHLKNLEFLELSGNRFQKIPAMQLRHCTGLRELHIRDNLIGEISEDINELKYLSTLDAGSNQIRQVAEGINLSYLKKIRLDNNYLAQTPAFLAKSSKLEYLNLNNNDISDISILAGMYRLQSLNLGDNPVQSVLPVKNLKKLEYLVLDWIDLSGVDPEFLKGLSALRVLSLEHCSLDDFSAFTGNWPSLEELSLIGNEFQMLPAPFRRIKSLKKIWLKGNPIPESEISVLAEALPDCQVFK